MTLDHFTRTQRVTCCSPICKMSNYEQVIFLVSYSYVPSHRLISTTARMNLTERKPTKQQQKKRKKTKQSKHVKRILTFHSLFISVMVTSASVSILFEHTLYFEKKLTFYSLFISVIVNTASVSILFEHTFYFEKN